MTTGSHRLESARMAAETLAIGALLVLTSLLVVTAGAGWCAAAEVVGRWHRGEEPPLIATFVRVVRRDWISGLAIQVGVAAIVVVAWFDVAASQRAHLPGAVVESIAVVVLATLAIAAILLTCAHRAATGCDWTTALHAVRRLPLRQLTIGLSLLALGLAGAVALVSLVPTLAVVFGGPLAFAVSAVEQRSWASVDMTASAS